MRKTAVVLSLFVLFVAGFVNASMLGFRSLELDFRKHAEVQQRVTWSHADKINLTTEGLKFIGEPSTSAGFSLETSELFALGFSWRPVRGATISALISPPPKPVRLASGAIVYPPLDKFFVRYSPDAKHWSSWQLLVPQKLDTAGNAIWRFQGQILIPEKETTSYDEKLQEYRHLDVAWPGDEHAAVEWIVKNDPQFFEKHLPFIGYLQFLFETSLPGGQAIEKINIDVSYAVGGIFSAPKDKRIYQDRDNTPWNFKD
jgi:hypothetical protein